MRKVMVRNAKNKKSRPQSLARISDVIGLSRQQIWNILYKKPRYDFSGIKQTGRDFLKEKRRIMDNHTCQICGRVWKEGERQFDVHHKNPKCEGIRGKKYAECKDLSKMTTLCHPCHMNLEQVKNKMRGKRK